MSVPSTRQRIDGPVAGGATKADLARGVAACEAGRVAEAIGIFRDILAQDGDDLKASVALARALFMAEEWAQAWEAFDVRFRLMESPPSATRAGPDGTSQEVPRWRGGAPPRRLLVLDEQGLGDTLQFIRFLPRLVAAGSEVVLVTHERLFDLVRSLGIPLELRPMGKAGRVERIDGWCPLLSLPGALGLEGRDLAAAPPGYIKADSARIASWAHLADPQLLRVGIAWQGNRAAPVDRGRSAPLGAFAPLAALPGVELVSLQRGDGAEQLSQAAFRRRVFDPGPDFDSGPQAFQDTAAVIMALDLVVTVDTSIAHLAGALGRPVWIALRRQGADWRWLSREFDTPWYPSARLYRQTSEGDWWARSAAWPPTCPSSSRPSSTV